MPNHQVLFTAPDGWGYFFFDLFSHSWLSPFLTSDFTNCTTGYMPNHQVPCTAPDGWVNFFLTSSPILDLEHFSQVILPIVLQIMPLPKNNNNHQVLFTASVGWVNFFLTSSPILDLEHFSQVILPIVLLIMPQLSGAVNSIWWLGFFFLTSSPILDLGHFSQVILPIVLEAICPTIRCCSQHLMVGVIFFSQVILLIVLLIMPQLSAAVHSIWWLGFFLPVLKFWT